MSVMLVSSKEQFDSLLSSEPVLVVDFFADWCGPCKMMEPIIESLANKYDGKCLFVKINAESVPLLSEQYEITNLPTMLYFKNGLLDARTTGARPAALIEKSLATLI